MSLKGHSLEHIFVGVKQGFFCCCRDEGYSAAMDYAMTRSDQVQTKVWGDNNSNPTDDIAGEAEGDTAAEGDYTDDY